MAGGKAIFTVPTKFPYGLSTADTGSCLESMPLPDPYKVIMYETDFITYNAGDWTVTETGSTTVGLVAGDGGLLSILNSASSGDIAQRQTVAGFIAPATNKHVYLKARFAISNATTASVNIGLQNINTDAAAATDGFFFRKASGATTLTFLQRASSTSSTITIGAMVASTYVLVEAHYSPITQKTRVMLNGNEIGYIKAAANLPTANLGLVYAVKNGTAAANTLTMDYLMAAKVR